MSRASLERKNRERAKTVGRTWGTWQSREVTAEMKSDYPHLIHCNAIWFNNRYEVQSFNCRSPLGGVVQLLVRRHFDIEEISWVEMQRIKRELFGEVLALEMYPPAEIEWKSETALRVMWILPTNWESPFGLHLETAWGNP